MAQVNLRVTAVLSTPMAGDAPRLDGLLEYAMSLHSGPSGKLVRGRPAPPQGDIRIPLLRRMLGGWLVGCCSDPILPEPAAEDSDHVCKRIDPGGAELLEERERKRILTGGTWTKSYRLPLRTRTIDRVVWFAVAHPRPLLKMLQRQIRALGSKTSVGYGRVSEWRVERVDENWSWYATSEAGTVLMSTLPIGPWLPSDLIGFRPDFGAVGPPYWHPDRYAEIVKPC